MPVSFASFISINEDEENTAKSRYHYTSFNKFIYICQVSSSVSPIDQNDRANDIGNFFFKLHFLFSFFLPRARHLRFLDESMRRLSAQGECKHWLDIMETAATPSHEYSYHQTA